MINSKFKKVFCYLCVFVIVFSFFTVLTFADSSNGVFSPGDSVIFRETLSSSFFPSSITAFFHVIDDNGTVIEFGKINLQYRGYVYVEYQKLDGTLVNVYSDGWIEDYYRTIYFDAGVIFTGDSLGFFAVNTFESGNNYYSTIYDIIVENVYGDIEITNDMKLTVSLISTILSILVILTPVILGGVIFVWILKRF